MMVLPCLKIGLTGVCPFRDVVLARGAFGDSVFGLLGCFPVAWGIFFELWCADGIVEFVCTEVSFLVFLLFIHFWCLSVLRIKCQGKYCIFGKFKMHDF